MSKRSKLKIANSVEFQRAEVHTKDTPTTKGKKTAVVYCTVVRKVLRLMLPNIHCIFFPHRAKDTEILRLKLTLLSSPKVYFELSHKHRQQNVPFFKRFLIRFTQRWRITKLCRVGLNETVGIWSSSHS